MKKILLLLLVNILSVFILFGCKSVDGLVKEGKYEEAYTIAKSNNEKNKVEWPLYTNKMYETLFSIVEPSRRHIYINRLIDDNEYKSAYLYADNDEEKKEIISKIIDNKAYYKLTISDDEKQMYSDVADELERRGERGESVILYCSLGTNEKKDLIDNYINLMINEENIDWLEKTSSYMKDEKLKDKINIKCYDYYWGKNDLKKCYWISSQIVSDTNYEKWIIAKMMEEGEFKELPAKSNSEESKKYNFYVNNVYHTIRWTAKQIEAESLSKIKENKKKFINSFNKVFNYLYTSKYDDDFDKSSIGRWYKEKSDTKSNILIFPNNLSLSDFIIAGPDSYIRQINASGNYGYEKYTRGKRYWENDKLICFFLDSTTGYDNQNLYKEVYAEASKKGLLALSPEEGISGLFLLFNSYIYSEDISWTLTTREGKSIDALEAVKAALIKEVDNGKI